MCIHNCAFRQECRGIICTYESVVMHHNTKYSLLKVLPVLVYGKYRRRGCVER